MKKYITKTQKRIQKIHRIIWKIMNGDLKPEYPEFILMLLKTILLQLQDIEE